MIEMEFENESVILKRQTFNAQPAFGKRTAVAGVSVQSPDSNHSQWSAGQSVARNKNTWDQTIRLRRGYGVTLSLSGCRE
jgi:hypothetical protein